MPRYWRWLLVLAAVAVLGLLSAWPTTGWLTRRHLRIATSFFTAPRDLLDLGDEIRYYGPSLEARRKAYDAALVRVAAEHPRDRALAIGLALKAPGQMEATKRSAALSPEAERLRPLLSRFPNDPVVVAIFVRACLTHQLLGARADSVPLEESVLPVQTDADAPPGLPPLREFDEACALGERLEPDNSLFPLARAAGLLAQNRDTEAARMMMRASRCSRFSDGMAEETRARRRINALASSDQSALAAFTEDNAIAYRHVVAVGAVATIMARRAARLESARRRSEGPAIRHALMVLGGRMRVTATDRMDLLLGVQIVRRALRNPAGAIHRGSPKETSQEKSEREAAIYLGYLRANGMESEAAWVVRLLDENRKAADVFQKAWVTDYLFGMLGRNQGLGVLCLTLLTVLLWLGAVGVLGWARSRRPQVVPGLPRPSAAGWGSLLGWCVTLGAWASCLHGDPPAWLMPVGLGVAMVSWLATLRRPHLAARLANGAAEAVLVSFVLAGLGRPGMAGASQFVGLAYDVVVAASLLFLLPVVSILLVIAGLVRRKPMPLAVAQGWAACAAPLGLLLVLGYGFTVTRLSHAEAQATAQLQSATLHEGLDAARRAHSQWPATVGGEPIR